MPATSHFQKAVNLTEQNTTMRLDKNNSQLSSSRETWESAINTLLTALENILLDENGIPIKQGGVDVDDPHDQKLPKGLTSSDTMMLEEFENSFGSSSSLKRKREDGSLRKNKSQKLLSSKLARNLNLSADELNDESIPSKADAHMDFCGVNPTPSHSSYPFQRNIRRCSRQLFGGRYARSTVSPNSANAFDMDIVPDHEPGRIQLLRRIMSDSGDSYLNWNATIPDWIELQARKRNTSLQEFQIQFQERTRDMESSLTVLHDSVPHVYDEIRDSVDRFLSNADWLRCDYYKPFTQIFPQLQHLGKKLENIVQFVEIVEDMKVTVNWGYPQTEDFSLDMKKIREVLEFKKSLYGEILQQNGLVWKAWGFPVNDAWIHETKQWLFDLSFHCLSFMNNELNKYEHFDANDTRIAKLMESVMNCIKIASITVDLIGTSSNKLILPSLILATAYTEWELSQIDRMESKVRCVEVRMMHIYDNINHMLHYLHIIQSADRQDITSVRENDRGLALVEHQRNLKTVENFSTTLVEAGLRLCEHIAKLKTNAVAGPSNFVYMYCELVIRFVTRALEYTGLEEIASVRMRPLLASLRNMENTAKFC